MIRLFHVYFPGRTLVLVLAEGLLIFAAFLAATYANFGTDAGLQLTYEHGVWKILVAAIVCLVCMHYYDLYGSFVLTGVAQMLARVVQVLGTSCLLLSLIYYAYPGLRLSFDLVLISVTLTAICLAFSRKAFLTLNSFPTLSQKALLLGNGPLAESLYEEVSARPEFGLTLMGYIAAQPGSAKNEMNLQYLGSTESLSSIIDMEGINRVIVAASDRRGNLPLQQLLKLKARGILIQDGGDLYEAISGKVALSALRPSWFLFSDGFCVSRRVLFYKRAASLFFSVIGLLITLPIIVFAAIAVRLDSPGPALFRQKRVGKGGKLFTLYKLRTMYHNADSESGFRPAQKRDPRFTRVGRWLRRTRIDELPQLFNILRGDMYLIGPRPFVPGTEYECASSIPFYEQRWTVKPGATGWAQIRLGYCATLEENLEKLSYDLFYIKNMSIGLDLLILFETVKILVLGRGSR